MRKTEAYLEATNQGISKHVNVKEIHISEVTRNEVKDLAKELLEAWGAEGPANRQVLAIGHGRYKYTGANPKCVMSSHFINMGISMAKGNGIPNPNFTHALITRAPAKHAGIPQHKDHEFVFGSALLGADLEGGRRVSVKTPQGWKSLQTGDYVAPDGAHISCLHKVESIEC